MSLTSLREIPHNTDGICKHLCILAIFHLYFLNKKHVCSLYYSQLEKEIIHSINQHVLSIHFVPSTVDKDWTKHSPDALKILRQMGEHYKYYNKQV